MKAICRSDGGFKGLIPDMDIYQKLQAGLADWKPHLKSKIKSVEIPYELFEHFMALDKDILEKNGEWYAEWVAEEITNRIKCSLCGMEACASQASGEQVKTRFCPHCGAIMK